MSSYPFGELNRRYFILPAALVALALIVGIGGAWWLGHRADQSLRRHLLTQAAAIARTVDAEQVRALSFTPADKNAADYQLLCAQMRAYATAMQLRSLYTMVLRGDNIVFGPESLSENDPYASPPGTVYEKPTPLDFEIFRSGRAFTQGPVSDEYGTFVSASAPVLDPHTGAVLMVIGIDVEARDWQVLVTRARLVSAPFTLALLSAVLAGAFAVRRRKRLPARPAGRLRHAEAVLCAVVGLLLTLAGGLLAHDAESRSLMSSFSAFARALSVNIAEDFSDLRVQLQGVARLFGCSDHVSRDEFRVFTAPLVQAETGQGWLWVPKVAAEAVAEVENRHRLEGRGDFSIWQRLPDGGRAAVGGGQAVYPALYIEPPARRTAGLGFNLGSEALRHKAMAEAASSGVAVASGLLDLFEMPETFPGVLVFQKAASATQEGFVAAAVDLEAHLMQSMRRSGALESGLATALLQLEAGHAPRFLASSPPGYDPSKEWHSHSRRFDAFFPLFLFSRTYALVVHPEPGWWAAHPLRGGWLAWLAGLLLTAVVVVLVAHLANRRASFEQMIESRTAQLRESEEKFALAFRTSPYALTITRARDGRFIEVNEAFVAITGYSREEALSGSSLGLSLWVNEKDRNQVLEALTRGEKVVGREFAFRRRNGDLMIGLFSAEIFQLKSEFCVLSSIDDVTERKRSEEEREKLQLQLLQSQKMESVGRLAGGIAHDFNNMLGVILGHVEIVLDRADPGHPLNPHLKEIQTAARRSADLTRQLLAFARKQIVTPRRLDLNDTVASMLKMLQRLIGENIKLVWKPGPGLAAVKIDPIQVDQILANLAVNARDAIAGVGSLVIETKNAVLDEAYCTSMGGAAPGDYVLLQVSDTGCGMESEVLERLYEPFFTTKEVGKGTGLGLATVYGIVKQNRGVIDIISSPGDGTSVRIHFPRAGAADAAPATEVQPSPRGGDETVLLVEDEEAILKLGQSILKRYGYRVLAAGSPRKALALVQRQTEQIHLMVTDIVMPEMNGRELAAKVREIRPEIKLLFISGYTADVIASHGVLDEGVHCLQKPFSVKDMAAKVRETLDEG